MPLLLIDEALITVDEFTGEIPASISQDRLIRQINAVSMAVKGELNRSLRRKVYGPTTFTKVSGKANQWLRLSRFPIESVQAVRIGGVEITDYETTELGDENGLLYRQAGWPMAAGISDSLTSDLNPKSSRFNIEIEYIGGWLLPNDTPVTGAIELPHDIRQAVFDEVIAGLKGSSTGAFSGGQSVIEERTPGGWTKKYSDPTSRKSSSRLSEITLNILSGYQPKRWA